MQFIRSNWEEAVAAVAERLNVELSSGKRVLWLVSGGSQIPANVQIMSSIAEENSRNLSVTLVDERYGPPGHADSNWQQLMDVGFQAKQAALLPVIQPGMGFAENTVYFDDIVKKAFAEHDFLLGQLGIGPDGHTSGILPHSPACAEKNALVFGYEAPPLQRITTTFPALLKLHAAYVLAFGDNKLGTLTKLQNENSSLEEQPAQVLKQLKEAYIYNDQLGDS